MVDDVNKPINRIKKKEATGIPYVEGTARANFTAIQLWFIKFVNLASVYPYCAASPTV